MTLNLVWQNRCCTIHKNRCTGFYKKGAHFFISIFSNYLPLFSSFNTSGFFFNSENWAPFLRQTVYVEKSQYCFFTKPSSSQARNFFCIYTELSKQQKQTEIRKNKILSRNQKKSFSCKILKKPTSWPTLLLRRQRQEKFHE